MSQVVILSKVAPCTSQPVTFNDHPNTRGCLTGLRKQVSEKADQSNFDSGLSIELSIGDEKHSLPLCAYVAGFSKSSHMYVNL